MEAIVLAGGLGTRLRSVVSELPKPMAPVAGRPFLEYLLGDLCAQGVARAVLATGYRHEAIRDHFGAEFRGMELVYSVEDQPLGTGGALRRAVGLCRSDCVLVANGDTFFQASVPQIFAAHRASGAGITVAVKLLEHFDRYGSVEFDASGKVVRFREKQPMERGYINGGVYCLNRGVFDGIAAERFSFEREVLEPYAAQGKVYALVSDGYFIDIGIPEDYAAAQSQLPGVTA